MNLIQTLYFNITKDPFCDSFGWAAPEYHLMGWALSCLQLHKLYRNISLYANSPAASLLVDTLQLPYTDINLMHDKLTLIHPDLWALPKIYTYSLQEQPFLHIDGDVFLFKSFDSGLLASDLIAQNVEEATEDTYIPAQKLMMQYFTFFPPCVKKDFENDLPFQACNAGILGGNNLSFFREYTNSAFEYIRHNEGHLKHVNINMFNVFFEQHLFFALAKEKGLSVNVVFEEIIKNNEYRNLSDFHDIPFNKSYLHLLGHFKRDEYTCIQMAAKLRELYPDYYERIVALFHHKNIRLSPCGFMNRGKKTAPQIDEESNTHLQRLKHAAGQCPPNMEKTVFQSDFEMFYRQIISFLVDAEPAEDLLARDLSAQTWYRNLFTEMSDMWNKVIVLCRKTAIIESIYNWAGLFNKYFRVGVGYYKDLQIEKGKFYNLVVREATDNGFSLYDINELDHALLQCLSEPLSINEILNRMQSCFDEDVLQNHRDAYENAMLSSIKKMVIQKAIQPHKENRRFALFYYI